MQLGRSQSAVSMQLKRLEEQAGRPLFTRQGAQPRRRRRRARRCSPTPGESWNYTTKPPPRWAAETKGAAIRLGLPQDFFEDVMPEPRSQRSARLRPGLHVEVMAGRNAVFEEEVKAGRLDLALAFFPPGRDNPGLEMACLPLSWFAGQDLPWPRGRAGRTACRSCCMTISCLFRQAAIRTLDRQKIAWRLSLTTPSLPGVWAALAVRARDHRADSAPGYQTSIRDVGGGTAPSESCHPSSCGC